MAKDQNQGHNLLTPLSGKELIMKTLYVYRIVKLTKKDGNVTGQEVVERGELFATSDRKAEDAVLLLHAKKINEIGSDDVEVLIHPFLDD